MVTGQNRKQEGVDLQQHGDHEEGGELSHDQDPQLGLAVSGEPSLMISDRSDRLY